MKRVVSAAPDDHVFCGVCRRFRGGSYVFVRVVFWSYLVFLVVVIVTYTIVGAAHY